MEDLEYTLEREAVDRTLLGMTLMCQSRMDEVDDIVTNYEGMIHGRKADKEEEIVVMGHLSR